MNRKNLRPMFNAMVTILLLSGFCLKADNDFVSIINLQNDSVTTTNRHISSYQNPIDRKILENGIFLQNRTELTKALEDFCS